MEAEEGRRRYRRDRGRREIACLCQDLVVEESSGDDRGRRECGGFMMVDARLGRSFHHQRRAAAVRAVGIVIGVGNDGPGGSLMGTAAMRIRSSNGTRERRRDGAHRHAACAGERRNSDRKRRGRRGKACMDGRASPHSPNDTQARGARHRRKRDFHSARRAGIEPAFSGFGIQRSAIGTDGAFGCRCAGAEEADLRPGRQPRCMPRRENSAQGGTRTPVGHWGQRFYRPPHLPLCHLYVNRATDPRRGSCARCGKRRVMLPVGLEPDIAGLKDRHPDLWTTRAQSVWPDSNRQPWAHEAPALPLSYTPVWVRQDSNLHLRCFKPPLCPLSYRPAESVPSAECWVLSTASIDAPCGNRTRASWSTTRHSATELTEQRCGKGSNLHPPASQAGAPSG